MSILIMNSFRGKNVPYYDWLKDSQDKLYLICSEKQPPHEGHYQIVEKIENYEENKAVITVAADFLKKTPCHTIIAKYECDILRAGELRSRFGIPGQTYEQALAFRDKIHMKASLKKAGIKTPDNKKINAIEDIFSFVGNHDFPAVIKPILGAGSVDVKILYNKAQIDKLDKKIFSGDFEIEEFIEGSMYHVDGIVLNGQLAFVYPSKYFNSCLDYQKGESLFSYLLEPSDEMINRLKQMVNTVLNALPTPSTTTFHAEIFHTKNDELVLCEIASRTGGGRINRLLEFAFGFNLDKIWIQAQAGLGNSVVFPQFPERLAGWVLIPRREGKLLRYAEGKLPDWVLEYHQFGENNHFYEKPAKSTDAIAGFIVSGKSNQIIIDRLHEIEAWFQHYTVWA